MKGSVLSLELSVITQLQSFTSVIHESSNHARFARLNISSFCIKFLLLKTKSIDVT